MELFQYLKTLIKHPSILRPYKRIILLSHMRANTSLFGHLLGSNPEIEGYYELHIGYYSWKSFIRQKLKYFAEHAPKKNAIYMFDKVLHNQHWVNPALFNDNDFIIIMIREPISTIESIKKLFSRVDPNHENTQTEHARAYYVHRLEHLVEYAESLEGKFYFLNADQLTQSPDVILSSLSKALKLKNPLNKRYQIFKKTGAVGAGDSSENMIKGEIQAKTISPVTYTGKDKILDDIYQQSILKLSTLAKQTIN